MGIEAIIGIVVSNTVLILWERWLGKTEKVDANSTAELAEGLVVAGIKKLLKR